MAVLMEAKRPWEGALDMAEQTFGARLKQLREAAGLTQAELAERAGINRYSVAKLEQDLYSPTWPTVQALAKALRTNCLAFEGTVEPPAEKPPAKKGRPRKHQPGQPGEAGGPPGEAPAGADQPPAARPGRKKS